MPPGRQGGRKRDSTRAGRGWSDAASSPPDGAQIATDLHTLLDRAHVPGPYVFLEVSDTGVGMDAETLAVHAGRPERTPDGPLNTPVHLTSTYSAGGPVAYGRYGNPTWTALEDALGALEGGRCLTFASGLAAVAMSACAMPGATTLRVRLRDPSSRACERARPTRPAFDAA